LNLCECGCKREVKNRFVSGHNFKVKPTILFGEKNGFYGKTHTEDNKKKCSAPHIGRKQSDGEREKRSESGKKRWAEDPKRKKSQICECGCRDVTSPGRKFITGHNRRGCGTNNHTGKVIHTKEWNRNISDSHVGKEWVRENGRKMGLNNKGKKKSEKAIESDKKSNLKKWSNSEFRDKTVRAIMKGNGASGPNKKELSLIKYSQIACGNDYKFTGNGEVVFGGRCPDFININGQKKIMELFGDYWHGEKRTGRTKEQEEDLKKSHYKKYGYDCLIIWENELKFPEQVIEKIKNFTYGGIQC